jgi:DNA-binding LacI/PurR family transcriptional regulator
VRTNGNGAAKTVTMADVAHRSGVSQGAISSLLNDRDYGIRVSLKTREKVFTVCRSLGYVPNDLRAVVRIYPELGETCILVSDKSPGGVANPFIARLIAEVMAQMPERHASVSVVLYDETHDYRAGGDLPSPLKHGTASKVMCVGSGNGSICRVVHERGLPAILLGHVSEVAGTTSVAPDYAEAARLALGLLVRDGHRRIGIVGGPFGSPEPRLAEMNRAIGEAAHELGIVVGAEDVSAGDLKFEAGFTALEHMLARSTPPTALLSLSESAAAGVVACARAHGLRVPDELSVVAFADHAGVIDSCIPLTGVVLPVDELASVAVREADRQIREGIPADARKITVGVRLIERGTTGPASR